MPHEWDRSVRRVAPHAALLFVQFAFASGAVMGKLAMLPLERGGGGVDPFALAMTRMIGAALVLQVPALRRRTAAALTRRDHAVLVALALLGVTVNQVLFVSGLKLTTATVAALLSVAIPVFAAGLSVALKKERARGVTFVGLAIAVVGVVYLTGVHDLDRGAAIVTANSLSYALYVVLARDVILRLGALRVVAWIFVWGAVLFAPLGIPSLISDIPNWSARSVWLVAYVVCVPTILAYVANGWALSRVPPSIVTAYIFLQPLIAAILAHLRLGEEPSPRIFVAAALIFVGVSVVAFVPRRQPI